MKHLRYFRGMFEGYDDLNKIFQGKMRDIGMIWPTILRWVNKNRYYFVSYLFRNIWIMNIWYTIGKKSGDINNISEQMVMLFDWYWVYHFVILYRGFLFFYFFGMSHRRSFRGYNQLWHPILMVKWVARVEIGLQVGEPKRSQNLPSSISSIEKPANCVCVCTI